MFKVSRAADRKKMVAELQAVAMKHGAECETSPCYSNRGTSVVIKLGVFRVYISIDGASRVGAFIGAWNADEPFPVGFGAAINGSVNAYHSCKATQVSEDFDYFVCRIGLGLEYLMA